MSTKIGDPGDLHSGEPTSSPPTVPVGRTRSKGPGVRPSSNEGVGAGHPPESAVTTAEIPVVRPRPSPVRFEQVRFDATSRLPPQRRVPAPLGLRLLVAVLFVLVLLGAVGLVAEHYHPSWFKIFRASVAQSSPNQQRTSQPKTSVTAPSSSVQLISSSAKNSTYRVPGSTYSLTVTPVSSAWVTVRSPATSGPLVLAKTLTAGTAAVPIKLQASSTLTVSAQVHAIEISSGGRQVGSIATPVVGRTYTFEPASR